MMAGVKRHALGIFRLPYSFILLNIVHVGKGKWPNYFVRVLEVSDVEPLRKGRSGHG